MSAILAQTRSHRPGTLLPHLARAPHWISVDPVSTPSTSNQGWDEVPFQRWYRFKEAFAPRLVLEAIEEAGTEVRRCCDPFGGGGTTSLVCQYLGIEPATIEVNPFLADLIEAKLTSYDVAALIDARAQMAAAVRTGAPIGERAPSDIFPGAPATLVEPGRGERWVFDRDVAIRISVHLQAIHGIEDGAIRRLFRVLLGSILLGVSNVVVNGKGRRYRRPSRQNRSVAADVDTAFAAAFERALFDVCRYEDRPCRSYTLIRGDARARAAELGPADLALFSPPYPNSFDYTDIYNVELWALGYLGTAEDNRRLRESTLRSHVQIKRDFTAGEVEEQSETLRTTLAQLHGVRGSLWNPHIPEMIAAYFADLGSVLRGLRGSLRTGGKAMMVIGDSRYAGVRIDVPKIVQELAPLSRFEYVGLRSVRAMRASAQQGGDFSLSESLLVLASA